MNSRLICLSFFVLAFGVNLVSARQGEEEQEESCQSPVIKTTQRADRFCITGEGQDVGYSFSIVRVDAEGNEVGDPIVSRQNVDAPGEGLNSTKLRDKFVQELNKVLEVIGRASADKLRDNCLFITFNTGVLKEGETFVLKVGEAGKDADRVVDEKGAQYNPMIFRVACSILEVPTLSPAGLVALSILLLLTGGIVIGRRKSLSKPT